jgi:hypothetical protein
MDLSVNDYCTALDDQLDASDLGDGYGWDINENGYIEIDYQTALTKDNVPCLVLGHFNPPKLRI